MRNVQKLLAAILLALALGAPALGGDMDCPPIAAPAPPVITSPSVPAPAPSDSTTLLAPDQAVDTTTLILNLLLGVLSI